MFVSRRQTLLASLATFAGCRKTTVRPEPPMEVAPPDGGPAARGAVRVLNWNFRSRPGTAESAAASVIVPAWGGPNERFPLLIALHGRGEALKPPAEGAMGWPKDYALVRAFSRLARPPLTANDFETFVEQPRLDEINGDLQRTPFGGLVVLCPHLPDVDPRQTSRVEEFSSFLFREIVPRVRKELPVHDDPRRTGIDGVSLGGAMAMWTGLLAPELFGAVGTLQPAIGENDAPAIATALIRAREKNPRLPFRLLTSTDDYFRGGIVATSRLLRERKLDHDLAVVPGPHDYPFNRGPGALEMLLWHDRRLRG